MLLQNFIGLNAMINQLLWQQRNKHLSDSAVNNIVNVCCRYCRQKFAI